MGKILPVGAKIFLFWYLRSSLIGGRLHLKHLYSLVWSHKLKFKIWGRSDQWLLRYFLFNIEGRLPLELIFILNIFIVWLGHISLSLKFGEDRTSGCWDIAISSWQFILSLLLLYYYYYYVYEIGQCSSRHSSLKSNLIGLVWIASWAAV